MPKVIQIRDVPDDVHAALVARADAAGLPLSRFALRELERVSRLGRNAEIFRNAALRSGTRPTADEIVAVVRAERERNG